MIVFKIHLTFSLFYIINLYIVLFFFLNYARPKNWARLWRFARQSAPNTDLCRPVKSWYQISLEKLVAPIITELRRIGEI